MQIYLTNQEKNLIYYYLFTGTYLPAGSDKNENKTLEKNLYVLPLTHIYQIDFVTKNMKVSG